ncbi:hypothetical protein B5X24_HaOG208491 [Helicoverpa armigera]|uniref:Uncharacterized protein n=1 Tax=Helicoverpa armigera TaxID=29058 RepID=A0A2W1BJT8_HELAM|nr:hypothetical protein B5X24_HaOG208491 [Helicoverpa armigera]
MRKKSTRNIVSEERVGSVLLLLFGQKCGVARPSPRRYYPSGAAAADQKRRCQRVTKMSQGYGPPSRP